MSASVASYVIARGLPAAVNFAAIAVYTRILTPAEYGRYAVILAWALFVCAIAFDWLAVATLRLHSVHRESESDFLGTVSRTYGILAITSGSAVAAAAGLGVIRLDWTGVAIVIALAWLNAYHALNSDLARARFKPVVYGILANGRSIGALAIGTLLIAAGWGGDGALVGLLISLLLVGSWAWHTQWVAGRAGTWSQGIQKELLSYGSMLVINYILLYFISTSDRLLIDWFLGADQAGQYAAGYDVPKQLLGTLMMIVALAGFPLAARAHDADGVPAARREMRRSLSVLMLVSLPATAGLALIAAPLAKVVFGSEFSSIGARLMPPVALGTFLWGTKSFYVDYGFALARRLRGQLLSTTAGAVTNLVLNLLWIPRYGLIGAAWSTVAAYAVAVAVGLVLVRRVFPLPSTPDLGRIIIATAGMSAAVGGATQLDFAPSLQVSAALVAGIVTYGMLALATNVGNLRRQLALAIARIGGVGRGGRL